MHIRNILKKGYSLFCYLQLYFRWYNKVVTERLKYNRKVLDMNIAAYCRVSTDKADQLNSLEAQKQFFSEYTQRTGDNLVRLYADEGISGTKIKNRKEFLRMMADAEHGLFDMVVVKDISRFARNTVDLLQNVRKLKALGIETQFLTANMTSMGNSEFVLTIFGALAQEESANTSKRVKFGKKMNAEKGRVPNIVYGYDKTIGDYFNLAINEEEAAVIRQIYKWYIEEGYGAAKIANMLNAKGIRTKRNCQWSQNATCRILTNELYTGKIINGKQEVADFLTGQRTEKDETEWMVTERPELRIIEPEMYEKAQEILKRRAKPRRLGTDGKREKFSRKYAFSCMLECGFCGSTLTRRSWHSGSQYNKVIWQCVTATKKGKKFCPDSKGIAEETIEQAFIESYRLLCQNNKDVLDEFIARTEETLSDGNAGKQLAKVEKDIAALDAKRDKLVDMRLEEIIDKDTYEQKYFDLSSQIEQLQKQREDLQESAETESTMKKRIAEFRKTLEENEVLDTFDRYVFESIVEKVIVGGYDEDGNKDPSMLTFIYKTGFKNSLDGTNFKPPRKNSKTAKQNAGLCSHTTDEAKSMYSYHSNTTRRDGCLAFQG